jgi:hypothetical protein
VTGPGRTDLTDVPCLLPKVGFSMAYVALGGDQDATSIMATASCRSLRDERNTRAATPWIPTYSAITDVPLPAFHPLR